MLVDLILETNLISEIVRISCKLSGQEEGGGDIETCLPLGAPEALGSLIFLVAGVG